MIRNPALFLPLHVNSLFEDIYPENARRLSLIEDIEATLKLKNSDDKINSIDRLFRTNHDLIKGAPIAIFFRLQLISLFSEISERISPNTGALLEKLISEIKEEEREKKLPILTEMRLTATFQLLVFYTDFPPAYIKIHWLVQDLLQHKTYVFFHKTRTMIYLFAGILTLKTGKHLRGLNLLKEGVKYEPKFIKRFDHIINEELLGVPEELRREFFKQFHNKQPLV